MSKKYYVLISLGIAILALVIFKLFINQGPGKTLTLKWKIYSVSTVKDRIYIDGMNKFIEDVKMMTDGQLNIEYIPLGEKGNTDYRKIFSTVAAGTVEMGFGISKFWEDDKITGNDFWYAIPFGLNARDMYDWLKQGGGLELWRKIYEGYNVVPFPIGDTGGAMGGWFRNKIENIDDLNNLNGKGIRDSGFPAKVWEKIGAVPDRELRGDIILKAYNRRDIDVIVALGPYVDQDYFFHKGPQYYYYPGWQQPCGVLSLIINKKKWDQLPGNFKKIIEIACDNTYHFILDRFNTRNSAALLELQKQGVKFMKFPPAVLDKFREYTNDVLEEEARKNTQFAEIYRSFKRFKENKPDSAWDKIVQEAVYSETTVLKFKEDLSNYIDKAEVYQKGNNAVVISFKDAFLPGSENLSGAVSSEITEIAKIIDYYSISIISIMVEVYIDISDKKLKSLLFKDENYLPDIDYLNLEPIKTRFMGRAAAVKDLLTKNNINDSLIRSIYDFDKSSQLEIVIEF